MTVRGTRGRIESRSTQYKPYPPYPWPIDDRNEDTPFSAFIRHEVLARATINLPAINVVLSAGRVVQKLEAYTLIQSPLAFIGWTRGLCRLRCRLCHMNLLWMASNLKRCLSILRQYTLIFECRANRQPDVGRQSRICGDPRRTRFPLLRSRRRIIGWPQGDRHIMRSLAARR